MEPKKNIYQKLLAIQQHVNGLGKDKSGFNNNYKYVTGDKILGIVKPKMNELGLLLKQEILAIENIRQDYKTKNGEKSEVHSKVMMRFTWIDTDSGEKEECLFGANGQTDWDKGIGSALTYAERYFLLKFFHIATDEDDIDNPEGKEHKQDPAPVASKKDLTPQEIKKGFDKAEKNLNKTELTPTHKHWNTIKDKLSSGVAMTVVEETFIISDENKKLLTGK